MEFNNSKIIESFAKVNNQSMQFFVQFSSTNGQPSYLLTTMAIFLNLIAFVGVHMNSAILYVTIKYRHLRKSTSSILLAITACFDVFHQMGHPLFLWIALSGNNFIPYSRAFCFLFLSFFGAAARFWSIPLIAMDRLIQIMLPHWHANINRKLYLGSLISANILLAAYAVFKFYQNATIIPNLPHTGFINDSIKLELTNLIASYIIIGTSCTILFYSLIFIWIQIKLKLENVILPNHNTQNNNSFQTANSSSIRSYPASSSSAYASNSVSARLFKSLLIIVGANVGGYLLSIICRRINIDALLHFDQTQSWLFIASVGILMNIFIAFDAPVLYACSTDYRTCFQNELRRLFNL